jgi:hypothetical protein
MDQINKNKKHGKIENFMIRTISIKMMMIMGIIKKGL